MSEHTKYLLAEQVAEILQRSQSTLANWRCLGQGPAYAKVGKRVMYRESDVYDFIEAQFTAAEAKR